MSKKPEGVREKVKGKRYEVYFRPYKGSNKIHRNIEAGSLLAARYKRHAIMLEYISSLGVSKEDRKRLTKDFVEVWETLKGDLLCERRPKKTIGRYKNTYWRMFGDFREKKFSYIQSPNQLNLPFFIEYKNYYGNELNRPKGIRGELIFVKAIMQRLYVLGYCSENLHKKLIQIKKPKPNRKEFPDISHTEMKKLLSFIEKDRPYYYPPIYFMFRTGRRRQETTLIKKSDVVLRGFKPIAVNIRAETTKTKEAAPLACLDEDLERLMRQALSNNRTEWLFPNRYGRKCTPDKIYEYLKKTSKAVLGVAITPHYFRHRFFTECGKANVPLADVKAISGIKDNDVVHKYYSHSTSEGLSKVLNVTRL